jgi:hypothetical protein
MDYALSSVGIKTLTRLRLASPGQCHPKQENPLTFAQRGNLGGTDLVSRSVLYWRWSLCGPDERGCGANYTVHS